MPYRYTGSTLAELGPLFGVKRELAFASMSDYMAFSKVPGKIAPADQIKRGRLTRLMIDVYLKTVLPAAWPNWNPVRLASCRVSSFT